jgi:hypothetical protein
MGQRTAQQNVNTSVSTMQGDRGARVVQFSLRLDICALIAPVVIDQVYN